MCLGLFPPRVEAPTTYLKADPDYIECEMPVREPGVHDMMLAIRIRPQHLLDFAITQLNAELIVFLREAEDWHRKWAIQIWSWDDENVRDKRVACYAHAALIYYCLVDDKAYYPINIHPLKREKLSNHFQSARFLPAESDTASSSSVDSKSSTLLGSTQDFHSAVTSPSTMPWDCLELDDKSSRVVTQKQMTEDPINATEALKKIQVLPSKAAPLAMTSERNDSATNVPATMVEQKVDVPQTFHFHVFDAAIKEAKVQAYHNVWLPFVQTKAYKTYLESVI